MINVSNPNDYYGRHSFKAALLTRPAMLLDLGGMLSNVGGMLSESWNHLTEANITKLTMPDTMLHRLTSGNPRKVFM